MLEKIIIGFMLGFFAGLGSDKAARGLHTKLTFWEFVIPIVSIGFVIYSFTYGVIFGLMAIVEILIGAFVGKKTMNLFKNKNP